jgi:hypothetical protein
VNLKRFLYLALIFGSLAGLVTDRIQQVRHENRTRAVLLQIQEALQRYHVDQERYPPRESLAGAELVSLLIDFEFLDPAVLNPWTGKAWTIDGVEPDHFRYGSDSTFETYSLQALDPKSGKIALEIDSVDHRSLE